MADPKIKYDIAANVSGDADVSRLASELEGLARTLEGDVKASALASAQALRQLGERQGAIEGFTQLKAEAQDAGRRLNEAQTAAQNMARELAGLDSPTRAQAGQMQKLRDAVRAAKQEVTDKTAAVQRARSGLQQYGIDTSNLAQKETAIRQAIAQARAEIELMAPSYQRAATAATAAGNAQKTAAAQAVEGVGRMAEQARALESIQRTLQATLAGVGLNIGLQQIKEAADTYAALQARVKLVTGEGEAFARGWRGVQEVAQRTNADLESTGTLFTRIAQAGRDAGLSTQQATDQALRLTETINQAIAITGGSAEASKAAITQLIQGLQSGVLRGEEFNSVMEQAPRLARALAQGLGVTTGELRKLAQEGQLTSSTVIAALQSQSATLRSEFEQLPPTIGRALQGLSNAWTIYIGEADKASGTSAAAARALGFLSENIGSVVGFLTDLGKTAAAFKLLDIAATLNAKAVAAANAARAIETEAAATARATLATRTNTVELERNALAKAGATTATGALTAAQERAAATSVTIGQRFGQVSAAATGMIARLASIGSVAGAAWLAISVGGDVVRKLGTALGEGAARLTGLRDRTRELEDSWRSADAQAQASLEIRARQTALNQAAIDKTFELTKANREQIASFDGLVAKGSTAAEAIAKIGKDFDLSAVPGIRDAGAVLDKLVTDGKLSAEQFRQAWADALKTADLGLFETQARAAFAGSAREAERMAAVLDATAREAIRRTGLDFDLISGGMGKAARSAINDTEAIIGSLTLLQAKGVDVGTALSVSLSKSIQTADSEKALEAVRGQIEAVRKSLGDKVADGLLQQATDRAKDLKRALDDLKPGVQSAEEAMRRLGITSDAELKRTAANSREAYEALRNSGTASARELQEAFRRYASDAIAANKGVADASLIGEGAMRGLRVATDDTGRAIVEAMGKGSDSVKAFAGDVRVTAEELAANAKKLQEIYDRNNINRDETLTNDGFKKGENGAAAGTFTNSLPLDQADRLRRAGGIQSMSDEELRTGIAQAKAAAADAWAFMKRSANYSLEYAQGINAMSNGAARAEEELARRKNSQKTLNVNVGGVQGSFTVNSQADADTATRLLRALEQDANRSAL